MDLGSGLFGLLEDPPFPLVICIYSGTFLVPRTVKGELEENSLKCLLQKYLTHFSLGGSSHPG